MPHTPDAADQGSRRRAATAVVVVSVLLWIATGPAAGAGPREGAAPEVLVLTIDGMIGPITADYFLDGLAAAEKDGARLLVLRLDTPGGLDTSMRQMIRAIMASTVPVAVYVAPDGARAASAGVFILTAAHLAAMAPATNVGAAHPVNMGGKMDETMTEKVTNDAVAYLQGLARQRGRNVAWSERVVRESVSVTADEALDLGVIDMIAPDLDDLLERANGRVVTLGTAPDTIRTAGAVVRERPMDWRSRFLQAITHPTVAYILLMLGFYGLFFELGHPGALFPGIVGAICLLLAFLAFQSLPVNYVGVILILLGLVLLILEIKVTSYGALTIGGISALLLGSLMMFDPGNPFGSPPLRVILPVVAFTAALFLVVIGMGLAAQRRRHATGLEALVGAEGVVVVGEGRRGTWETGRIRVAGEYWECRATAPLRAGDRVRVVGRRERCLTVEPVAEDDGNVVL